MNNIFEELKNSIRSPLMYRVLDALFDLNSRLEKLEANTPVSAKNAHTEPDIQGGKEIQSQDDYMKTKEEEWLKEEATGKQPQPSGDLAPYFNDAIKAAKEAPAIKPDIEGTRKMIFGEPSGELKTEGEDELILTDFHKAKGFEILSGMKQKQIVKMSSIIKKQAKEIADLKAQIETQKGLYEEEQNHNTYLKQQVEDFKGECDEWEKDHHESVKEYSDMLQQIDRQEKEIAELKEKNARLKEQLAAKWPSAKEANKAKNKFADSIEQHACAHRTGLVQGFAGAIEWLRNRQEPKN